MKKTQRHRRKDYMKTKEGNEATNQKVQRIASSHQKFGKRHGIDSPAETSEGASLANTLILESTP